MEKLQTIVVVLLILAIIFSVASVVMNIYLANLKPVTAGVVNAEGAKDSNGGLQIAILPPSQQEGSP